MDGASKRGISTKNVCSGATTDAGWTTRVRNLVLLGAKAGAFALLLSYLNIAAASTYMGYVTSIVQIDTRTFIYVGNGWFGSDNCGSGRTNLVLYADTSTADGRSFISMALSAKLTGNQVYAAGNGSCWTGNTPNGGVSEQTSVMWLQ